MSVERFFRISSYVLALTAEFLAAKRTGDAEAPPDRGGRMGIGITCDH